MGIIFPHLVSMDFLNIIKFLYILKFSLGSQAVNNDDLKEELEILKETMEVFQTQLAEKDVAIRILESQLEVVRDPPYCMYCASRDDHLLLYSQPVNYDKVFYSSTNVDGADLDVETGLFTSGHPGSYTVSFTYETYNTPPIANSISVYLRKNGELVEETAMVSRNTGAGEVSEMASRTVVLHLERGDTLDLFCTSCTNGIYHTTFCVTLS